MTEPENNGKEPFSPGGILLSGWREPSLENVSRERRDDISALLEKAGDGKKYITPFITEGCICAVSALICGRIAAAAFLMAVTLYMQYRGKLYRWVFPVGRIIGAGFGFMAILGGTINSEPAIVPDVISGICAGVSIIAVPADIFIGLFFIYSKKLSALNDYYDYLDTYCIK